MALLALLLMAGQFLLSSPARAATQTTVIDGVTYAADDANPAAGASITDYDPAVGGTDIQIPSEVTINGVSYPVTAVGDRAFRAAGLTSVVLPGTVITIGHGAFWDNDLTSAYIPPSVTAIGGQAFYDNALTEVTIPSSLTTLGAYAFAHNDLTTVTIPPSVTVIDEGAFMSNQLTSVSIPSSVTAIGDGAFWANQLSTVTIPASVTAIGDYAFWANQLSTVSIPSSVTTIGQNAFNGSPALAVVKFDGNAPAIAEAGPNGSFGAAGGKTLCFSSTATGFSTPTWRGYTAAMSPFTITFETGEQGSTIPTQAMDCGQLLEAPADPARDGYTFAGWYTGTEDGGIAVYDFATPVTQDLTLYALWALNTYTVTFDTGEGSSVDGVSVEHGGLLDAPSDPVQVGYAFAGWFTDPDGDVAYDFTAPVTGDLVLYAGWAINTYTVTFDTGEGSSIGGVTVEHGELLDAPVDPIRDGYAFAGWFTDAEGEVAYDFTASVTGDLVLYAAWQQIAAPVAPIDDDDNGASVPAPAAQSGTLPVTGASVSVLTVLAALLAIAAGAVLMVSGRVRPISRSL